MKRGFTLIELVVVLGIFGILMVAGTEFFIQVIKNSNQATMQNEVRQEANKIMQDVTNEARKGTPLSIYTVDVNGVFNKNGVPISSTSVAVTQWQIVGNTVTLTVQQASRFVRSDFKATVTLTQTVTPRVY